MVGDTGDLAQLALVISFIASIASSFVAVFALINIVKTSAASKSKVLFTSLDQYIRIQKDRRKAEMSNRRELIEEYYRETFDLLWTEFQAYKLGYIDKERMKIWMSMASNNYNEDEITITDKSGTKVTVTYKQVWNNLCNEGYFSFSEDAFVKFMADVHTGHIDKALKNAAKKWFGIL